MGGVGSGRKYPPRNRRRRQPFLAEKKISWHKLNDMFTYNPKTGIFFWKYHPNCKSIPGSVAGSWKKDYVILEVGRVHLFAHRVAWFLMTGKWPPELLDHKDGNGLNNIFTNLRLATASQNSANSRLRIDNTTGVKGVYKSTSKINPWFAMVNGEYLGSFSSKEEAAVAYYQRAKEIWGEFASNGVRKKKKLSRVITTILWKQAA